LRKQSFGPCYMFLATVLTSLATGGGVLIFATLLPWILWTHLAGVMIPVWTTFIPPGSGSFLTVPRLTQSMQLSTMLMVIYIGKPVKPIVNPLIKKSGILRENNLSVQALFVFLFLFLVLFLFLYVF